MSAPTFEFYCNDLLYDFFFHHFHEAFSQIFSFLRLSLEFSLAGIHKNERRLIYDRKRRQMPNSESAEQYGSSSRFFSGSLRRVWNTEIYSGKIRVRQ